MDLDKKVDEIVASLLPETPVVYSKSKYINDSILGSVEVRGYEQSIIDTPLFQRLRFIRQTGFTFFTFPTAHHTRFEHSLGVMTIATKIFNVIREKHGAENPQIDNTSLARIRLAALLHDTGHSAFSHTSEEFYSTLDDIKEFKAKTPRFKSKGEGEILSYLIVNSNAFKVFFEKLKGLYKKELETLIISEVADLITSKQKSSDYGYEADIISGPTDADKLDYFPRDGRAAGLEVSLDIHRLINCIELQDLDTSGGKRKSLIVNRRGYMHYNNFFSLERH